MDNDTDATFLERYALLILVSLVLACAAVLIGRAETRCVDVIAAAWRL